MNYQIVINIYESKCKVCILTLNCIKYYLFSEIMKMVQPHNRTLECKNLHDYLRTLPGDVLAQLYNHPATCLAVFRWGFSRESNSRIANIH